MKRSTSWILALALVLSVVTVLPAAAADADQPAWSSAPTGVLQGVAMGRIDDMIEVAVWITDEDEHGVTVRKPLAADDITEWTIVAGDGKLLEDPATGRVLFRPEGAETLVVAPRVGSLVGEPITVGMSPVAAKLFVPGKNGGSSISGGFDAGGGGHCVTLTGPRMFDEAVDVRSVVSASVIPVTSTERVVRYAHGDYYAYHEDVGTMRIQYNTDRTSEVKLTSLSPTGEPFFPAVAEGALYFTIETLRDGYKTANWQPLTIEATVLDWPPFETPIMNSTGAGFFSTQRPDVEMHRIDHQEFYIYPTKEIDVVVKRFDIVDGELLADFELVNKTKNEGPVRWFLIGDINKAVTSPTGVVDMSAESRHAVSYRADVASSAIPQFVTIGAVSETGARMVGFKRIDFDTSTARGQRVAFTEVPMKRANGPQGVTALAAAAPSPAP